MTRRSREAAVVECSECGARDAIQIELTLPDDTEVTFNSCHRCENRWWESNSKVIDLTTVLEKARRR
ncbi:MAG: hypothetical protein A2Z12_03745 [Actinobacteria bacterium RBG_16_68_21]|nr:MAG: hypothetical protein A2Z12_03745 [Actinobacteria bacterium RBG_16_68_21]